MKRLVRSFTAVIGLLGVVVCVGVAGVVWLTGSRLGRVNEAVFTKIDELLAAGRGRVLDAQKRVQDSKITTEDVAGGVEIWMSKAATDRLALRLEAELKRTEHLASGLRQADLWLETSAVSLQGVQQALEIANAFGASADTADVVALLERLLVVRGQLNQATDAVDALRERMARTAEGETLEERASQVVQLALRVLATLGEVDSHLGQFAEGLLARQAVEQDLKQQLHGYIVAAQVGAVLVIVWMAAGQVALSRHGWKRKSGTKSTDERVRWN